MTLSAIDRDLAVVTPYRIPEGPKRLSRFIEIKNQAKTGQLACPHCFELTGDFIEVRFKICQGNKRSHFAHRTSGKPCSKTSQESHLHEVTKIFLANQIQKEGKLAAVELNIRDPRLGLQCRPDVVAMYLETKEAHEVQLSRIDIGKLKARTDTMIQMGFNKVSWYLYGSNYNEVNREYLDKEPLAQCYHLAFGENNLPKWRPDRGFRLTPISRNSTPYDRCSKRSTQQSQPEPVAQKKELKPHTFNPGDLVQVRGMPPERIYSYSSKIELHGQENYFVLSVGDRETQWPQSCCIPVENSPQI